jgi:hypothetical protein
MLAMWWATAMRSGSIRSTTARCTVALAFRRIPTCSARRANPRLRVLRGLCRVPRLKRTGIAVAQLILTLSIVALVITVLWHLVDAFLIAGWIRRENTMLAWTLGLLPFAR